MSRGSTGWGGHAPRLTYKAVDRSQVVTGGWPETSVPSTRFPQKSGQLASFRVSEQVSKRSRKGEKAPKTEAI